MNIEAREVLRVLRAILPHDQEKPITGRAIEEGWQVDPRSVAASVALLTEEGYAVCSGGRGYFYARTRAEFEEHLEKEDQRAMALLSKTSQARKNFVDQPSLFEIEAA
jgi:hypothetical protein